MVASAVFFLDIKGKVLISRNYRGDIAMDVADRFMPLLAEYEEEQRTVTPILSEKGIHYIHIRYNNLYLLALTRRNSNVTTILMFLHKLVEVFTEYFCELEEESLRDNFVIIYELLDEMMDFGHPQTTDTQILKEYITQKSFQLETVVRPPQAITSAVSWRPEGIKYRKNEVFLDVVESINLLVNTNGNVLVSEVLGAVKVRCFLSGMPELRLGLNEKVAAFDNSAIGGTSRSKPIEMEDIKFHQCVRLQKFENDRTISFIPPDGDFELMSYRISAPNMKPLIWAECIIEKWTSSQIEYLIKAKAQFKRRSAASNVEIIIPVPEDADTPRFKTSIGSASHAPEKGAIIWQISYFPGGKEFTMRARVGLPSIQIENQEKKSPISIKFEIPYFTMSGMQVRYLKVIEKSGYPALPWVRYITQNGDYQFRMPDNVSKSTSITSGAISSAF